MRWLYLLGVVLAGGGLLGLNLSSRAVPHAPVALEQGVPAVVYEPPAPFEAAPALILTHGYAGDLANVSTLARGLARAGYVVITPELRGHGGHPLPLPRGALQGRREALRQDVEAAVAFARGSPRVDPARVAVAGHSMGASVVLDWASTDPGIGAVVGISGLWDWSGPYTPPNVLLIWASGDYPPIRQEARVVAARLADLPEVEPGRAYGDPERGTAVQAFEVEGTSHWSVLQSEETQQRIRDWLELTIGPGVAAPAAVGLAGTARAPWSLLTCVGLAVLLFGLARTWPRIAPRPDAAPEGSSARTFQALLELALALGLGVLLSGGAAAAAGYGPAGFLPLAGGREILSMLLVAGVGLGVLWHAQGRVDLRAGWHLGALGGALLFFLLLYSVVSAAATPLAGLWLTPQRCVVWVASSLLALPFFLAAEQRLRSASGWRAASSSAAARVLVLVAVGIGAAGGLLSFAPLVLATRVLFVFGIFEVLALRLTRPLPDPWLCALLQSFCLAWILAASAPIDAALP